MQLIIDVGNTSVKAAVFNKDLVQEKRQFVLSEFINGIDSLVTKYPVQSAIISSVGRLSSDQVGYVENRFPAMILSEETSLPFINEYATPKTLGVDRMGLVAAFAKAYPKQNGLIIDVGTCITYDFITAENIYKGGAISPGIRLRYECLHNLTANLPLLNKEVPLDIVGASTEQSMHSGVINGIILEIDGAIQQYRERYDVDTVIITGGDAEFLAKRLKNSIFAPSNFLLEGLNHILRSTND